MAGRGRGALASIVIADSNKAVMTALSHALELKGIKIAARYSSIDELAQAADARKADAILLHFNIEGAKVAEALPRLRSIGPPIIVMSGDEENLGRSIDAGADAFFYKDPRNIGELAETILKVSGRAS
jgi:DNA-binding NarL/FixJ family response regulator